MHEPSSLAASAIGCPGAPRAPSCCYCLFGAEGDLARRLLIPAFYNLAASDLLDENVVIIGIDRRAQSDAEFAASAEHSLRAQAADPTGEFGRRPLDESRLSWLMSKMRYLQGDIASPSIYVALVERIGRGNAVFHLALPPVLFAPVAEKLGAAGLLKGHGGNGWRRIVVEKPFGEDLASARILNARLLQHCDENQIYRIDHFLGKETVQNIMAIRFANRAFEPLWNRHHIEQVCIEARETLGVERRGRFYDATGALRDMVPNHLFQLLAMVAMEAPDHFSPAGLRHERCRLMNAVRVYTLRQAAANGVRAQYAAGNVQGRPLSAYRDSPDVASASTTETFAALRMLIDNRRWEGVPFHLVTGKALGERRTRITVRLRPASASVFDTPHGTLPACNELVLQIQPNESVFFRIAAKAPGPTPCLQPVDMSFCYADYFRAAPSTGYETLLYDSMTGDMTLFQRAEQIESAWAAVQPFLDAWRENLAPLYFYAAGSDGPHEAISGLSRDDTIGVPALLRQTPVTDRAD